MLTFTRLCIFVVFWLSSLVFFPPFVSSLLLQPPRLKERNGKILGYYIRLSVNLFSSCPGNCPGFFSSHCNQVWSAGQRNPIKENSPGHRLSAGTTPSHIDYLFFRLQTNFNSCSDTVTHQQASFYNNTSLSGNHKGPLSILEVLCDSVPLHLGGTRAKLQQKCCFNTGRR